MSSTPISIPNSRPRDRSPDSESAVSYEDAIDDAAMHWTDSSLESSPVSHSPVFSSFPALSSSPLLARSPGIYGDSEHLPRLERDFMTDFSCCGLTLTDLHELLSHFEDTHVLSVEGKSSASGPLATVPTYGDGVACDEFAPRLDPRPSNQDDLRPPSAFDTVFLPPGRPTTLYVDALARPAMFRRSTARPHSYHQASQVGSSNNYDDDLLMDLDLGSSLESLPLAPACLSPTLLVAGQADGQEHAAVVDSAPELDRPTGKTKKRSIARRADRPVDVETLVWSSDSSLGRKSRSSLASSAPRRQKAPKAFQCPHVGCTKSYLNPNGLKYHLNKGTCDFGDSSE